MFCYLPSFKLTSILPFHSSAYIIIELFMIDMNVVNVNIRKNRTNMGTFDCIYAESIVSRSLSCVAAACAGHKLVSCILLYCITVAVLRFSDILCQSAYSCHARTVI